MLIYNLTVEYGAEFGVQISGVVVAKADETKANLKRQNAKPVYMKSDVLGFVGAPSFNIFTGE